MWPSKWFRPRLRSLKSRLVVWVFLPIALIVAIDLIGTYHSTEQIATATQQQLLHGSAKMISEQLVYGDDGYEIRDRKSTRLNSSH